MWLRQRITLRVIRVFERTLEQLTGKTCQMLQNEIVEVVPYQRQYQQTEQNEHALWLEMISAIPQM